MIQKIKSFSNPNKEYEVNITELDASCTCPDYVYRKKVCKHILKVLEKQDIKNFSPDSLPQEEAPF